MSIVGGGGYGVGGCGGELGRWPPAPQHSTLPSHLSPPVTGLTDRVLARTSINALISTATRLNTATCTATSVGDQPFGFFKHTTCCGPTWPHIYCGSNSWLFMPTIASTSQQSQLHRKSFTQKDNKDRMQGDRRLFKCHERRRNCFNQGES